ncbi:cell number regulator 2 [Impatiens glandulifera]|uniref:cell number regulator 2 n=1 Tax=Impatiens glandulifera TaxID=253017 RepID=UPI001FB17B40|nr:cell number regulator 2 [Impatiens glandulifera]
MAGSEDKQEEEEQKLLDGVATLDFDMLCSMVAMQTEGKRRILNDGDDDDLDGGGAAGESGGVFRMWEGELLDCFDDRRLAIETVCCPCYRFGKNMERAGLGHCFIQGFVYFSLLAVVIFNLIAFTLSSKHCFLYMGFGFALSFGAYLGFFRRQIQTKFNIKDNDSSWDGCIFHLLCPCCTLCQESRTLEMNNVRDGIWIGRADSICISSNRYGESTKTVFQQLHPPAIVLAHV